MAKTLAAFKRAFAKKFSSSATNYHVRRGKVEAALTELDRAVAYMEKQGIGGSLQEYKDSLDELRRQLGKANELAKTQPKEAYAQLERVKALARARAQSARDAAKKVPMGVKLASGSTAKVFPPDIPAFEKLSPGDQDELVKKVGAKISSGQDLYDKLMNDPKFGAESKPAPKDVADLMWFLKSKAQEKAGAPYERGAMTIPDPDNKLRNYLDKCTEVYGRDSSHLPEQQRKQGGQARGIDFYEGVKEQGVADPDKLLPSGMRTLLYQQVTSGKGANRIYLKMETESARFNPFFKQATETPNPRTLKGEDVGRSILHLGNLIKAKLGMSQGEDQTLPSFREQLDQSVAAAYEGALKAAKKESPDAFRILGKPAKRVHQIMNNMSEIGEAGIVVGPVTYDALVYLGGLIIDRYGMDNLEARFGGEVVLDGADIADRGLEPETALGILNTNLSAVEGCQRTDAYEDLVKVQRNAQKALADVASTRALANHKVVQSTAKHLNAKLAPLVRLIAKLRKPKGGV